MRNEQCFELSPLYRVDSSFLVCNFCIVRRACTMQSFYNTFGSVMAFPPAIPDPEESASDTDVPPTLDVDVQDTNFEPVDSPGGPPGEEVQEEDFVPDVGSPLQSEAGLTDVIEPDFEDVADPPPSIFNSGRTLSS